MNTNPAIPRQRQRTEGQRTEGQRTEGQRTEGQRTEGQRTEEGRPPSRALRVLTVNPGSSSLKLAVLDGETLRFGHTLPGGSSPCWPEVQDLVLRYDPVDAIAIRFMHGGDRAGPVLLDEPEIIDLDRLSPRAPLHQPQSVQLARMLRAMVPDVPVVGCFDTSFHVGLPEHAARYALPRPWAGRPELRRAGFHGLSCAYAHRRAAAMLRTPVDLLGLVVAHVGAGVSVTAIEAGRSMDTSMGFTPTEGAVMATRSGSLDPGLVLHLLRSGGLNPASLEIALTERAGLAGLTGGSGDMRAVLAARAAGDPEAAGAVRIYLHRLRREIAATAASLVSLDALVLTGGVAEGSAWLRSELVSGLRVLGARLDYRRNREASHDALLSEPGEQVAVLLVQAGEEVELARGAAAVLAAAAPPAGVAPLAGGSPPVGGSPDDEVTRRVALPDDYKK